VLATVLDEAMVWAATWAGRRFCVCAELTTRFLREAKVGAALRVEAGVDTNRGRLLTTSASIRTAAGEDVASGTGKYVPVPPERNRSFLRTLVPDPATRRASAHLLHE
jgi:acyl-coenzyme A thioesterase PaaI-like protein